MFFGSCPAFAMRDRRKSAFKMRLLATSTLQLAKLNVEEPSDYSKMYRSIEENITDPNPKPDLFPHRQFQDDVAGTVVFLNQVGLWPEAVLLGKCHHFFLHLSG